MMKYILFVLVLVSCQHPPHSKKEYNDLIEEAVKKRNDTINYLINNHQPVEMIEIRLNNQIDSLARERDRWYK